MAETETKLPVQNKNETGTPPASAATWPGFDDLRREVDRLFDDFGRSDWLRRFRSFNLEPMLPRGLSLGAPAIDIVEHDTAYDLTAEMPGMTARDIDVSLANGMLVIKGEKREEKEEKDKSYHLRERQFGAFERRIPLPSGADASAVEARFDNGVLKVSIPKSAEAQKPAKKIDVKAA